jgi:lipoprotein-anchoring transpeptidase ErfK/SrfK
MNRILFAAGAAVLVAVSSAAFVARDHANEPELSTAVVADNGFGLKIDLSERRLYVMNGGEETSSYPVAIGAPNFPTPKGNFRVRRITWNPRWVPPDSEWARKKKAREPGDPKNPMGRVKIFFREPDYYIHGTREVDSLGQAESHGCIRMRNSDVIAVAKQVMANGGASRPPNWFRRVLNRVTSTQDVRLGSPVPVQIVG